jgi:hypothetical protein
MEQEDAAIPLVDDRRTHSVVVVVHESASRRETG